MRSVISCNSLTFDLYVSTCQLRFVLKRLAPRHLRNMVWLCFNSPEFRSFLVKFHLNAYICLQGCLIRRSEGLISSTVFCISWTWPRCLTWLWTGTAGDPRKWMSSRWWILHTYVVYSVITILTMSRFEFSQENYFGEMLPYDHSGHNR